MPVVRSAVAAVLGTALGAALVPALVTMPAAAGPAPDGCGGARLTGSARADLIRVQALNPHAFHLPASPVGLRVATTEAELATQPARTAASAHALTADPATAVSGPVATQQAPPVPLDPTMTGSGVQVHSPAVAAGAALVGTGDLHARAGYGCDAGTPPIASASASLVDATVLPGAGGASLLHLPHNLASDASAALTMRDHRASATVTARIGPTDLRLFDGTAESVQLRVLTSPELTVVAGAAAGHAPVRYTAPLVEVRLPSGTTVTLDTPSKQVDVPLTPAALTAFGLRTGSSSGPVVARLSLGSMTQHITTEGATAEAATLWVRLLCGGTTAAELGVGVLSATASASTAPGAAPVPAPGGGTASGSLPVTGVDVGWLLGIGLLLAIGGRLLLVVSRRPGTAIAAVSPAEGLRRSPEPAPEAGS